MSRAISACFTFVTTIPGVVVIISTVLAVAVVVLSIVRDQVLSFSIAKHVSHPRPSHFAKGLESESIVRGDEVDRMEWLSAIVLEKVRAPADPVMLTGWKWCKLVQKSVWPCGKITFLRSITFDEASNGVSEDAIPKVGNFLTGMLCQGKVGQNILRQHRKLCHQDSTQPILVARQMEICPRGSLPHAVWRQAEIERECESKGGPLEPSGHQAKSSPTLLR